MKEENIYAPQNSIREEALRYVALGFSAMPLGLITKDATGKKDIDFMRGWKKYQSTVATPEEISGWNCKNLGIATGQVSGLLVLDVDSYKEGFDAELLKSFELPITPMQETASGGRQYLFKLPKGLIIKNDVCIGSKGSGIDVRGDGGMVIVPPSTTSYGEYTWVVSPFDEPLAEIPPKLLALLTEKSADVPKTKKSLTELIGLKEGEGRNNALASLIGKLLLTTHQDHWNDEVWPIVVLANNTYNPPLSNEEVLLTYESITKIERVAKATDKTHVASFLPALTHAELIAKEFSSALYTIEPFFEQGTVNMVSAPPNTWKSWLLFLFAGAIATGSTVFEKFKTEKANVMIVNEEDSCRLIQDRLRLLGITDPSLPIYYRVAHGAKLTDDFIDSLIMEAKEKNVGVIMFDSLRSVHDADENDSTKMQGVMDMFKKIARESITVIFTHHNRKSSVFARGADSESTRGSSAINAAVSGHISLEESNKGGDKYLLLKHLKSKAGEKLQPLEIGVDVLPDKSVHFHYRGEHEPKGQALAEAKVKIINYLKSSEVLISRKDFVYLDFGRTTTVKEATNCLEKEGAVQVISRKDAERSGLETLTPGKSNEKLYFLKKEDVVDDPDDF